MTKAWRIRVNGLVQGVGFRPTVWRLARRHGLRGTVRNDARGVDIMAWAEAGAIEAFLADLRAECPPLARIDELICAPAGEGGAGEPPADFTIATSREGTVRTSIGPDAATCDACLAEVLDPAERRYRYPFTNCTHCGPRLTITRALPYDRANTSMSAFPMCADCRCEYEDPADRRFHAQPVACPACGPRLWLADAEGRELPSRPGEDAIAHAARLLREGRILAIRGLGGFHLACDAGNDATVEELRRRKRRYGKPFALMARDLAMVRRVCEVPEPAEELLTSSAAPIVLLKRRDGPDVPHVSEAVAPGQNRLGVMLPMTPLHHLLARDFDGLLVMTSGNVSGEPQVTENTEALERLRGIADLWVLHDRNIVNRVDDSVVQFVGGASALLRRARGYAPSPLKLHEGFADVPPVFAVGADLKNTFCLLKEGAAIVSQHIGDMDDAATRRDAARLRDLFWQMQDFRPAVIAADMHPGYHGRRVAEELAAELDVPLHEVQHHHAHVAACMAERGYAPDAPALPAVVLDGLGFGADGTLWGGEALVAGFTGFERVGHFAPVPMPGGDAASRQPWRNAVAHLHVAFGWEEALARYGDLPGVRALVQAGPAEMLVRMMEKGVNAPPASSAGRLFDAVAALLGLHAKQQVTFEGEAAMALQALAERCSGDCGAWEVPIGEGGVVHWRPLWEQMFKDMARGTERAVLAARFHETLARVVVALAENAAKRAGQGDVVLSGGVFQNVLLAERTMMLLEERDMRPQFPRQFPANDGGISLGQVCITAAMMIEVRAFQEA